MSGRIRTIKPEILEDAKTASLNSDAWRLFVSLFLVSDDYGNFRATPTLIEGLVFHSRAPREPVVELLAQLSHEGLILLYESNGQKYGAVANWKKHQRVDKPSSPRVPGPYDASSVLSRDSREEPALLSRLTPTPIPTCTSDRERRPVASEDRNPPPVRTMAEAKALVVNTSEAKALFDHWDAERGALRKYALTLMPPPAALDTCRRIITMAGGLDAAMRAVSAFVNTDREYYRDRHWALFLLEKDFEEHAAAPEQKRVAEKSRVPKNDIGAEMRALAAQVEVEKAAERARKSGEVSDAATS